jgi:hypothetical protein
MAGSSSLQRRECVLAVALLLVHVVLCTLEARHQSATVDEFHLVPQAVTLRATGDLELGLKTPPFLKRWIGLALDPAEYTLVDARFEGHPARDGWEPWIFATRFMQANRAGWERLFDRARAMMLPFSLLLGAALWAWARRLGGPRAGLIALVLFAFAPEFLSFGSLVSLDLAVTALLVAQFFAFREALVRGKPALFALSGVLLGLALSVKTTALLVAPLFCLLVLPFGRARGLPRRLLEGATLALAALLALHATYGFHAPFPRLDELSAASRGFARLHASLPAGLRLPLPREWLCGFDFQAKDVEIGDIASYLDGQWSSTGWKHYYLLAWLYKTPLALLGFVLVVALGALRSRRASALPSEVRWPRWVDIMLVLGPLALWGGTFSLTGQLNIGVRYVLPCYAFLLLGLAVLAARIPLRSLPGLASAALLVAFVLSSLATFPHHLGSFNALAGGSTHGWRHLVDSNADWGQELEHLGDYAKEHALGRISLAYFGHVAPELYGLDYALPTPVPAGQTPAPGWYAISVNYLAGYSYLAYDHGNLVPIFGERLAGFRELAPLTTLGGALHIYHVE